MFMLQMFQKTILEQRLNLFLGKISFAVYILKGIVIISILYIYLLHDVVTCWIFENFNTLNLFFKNLITAGRLKCCGMKDRTHGCRKTKKQSLLECPMDKSILEHFFWSSTFLTKVAIFLFILREIFYFEHIKYSLSVLIP